MNPGQNGDNQPHEDLPARQQQPSDEKTVPNGFASASFYVDQWLVEPRLNRISRNGTTDHIEPKTMAVLVFLAEHQGRVVDREELFDSVWGSTFVTDNTLTRTVSRLRRALQDDWQNPRYLETISKSGYRLIASVRPAGDDRAGAESTRRTSLVEGQAFVRRRWTRVSIALAVLASSITVASVYIATLSSDSASTALDPQPVLTLVGRQTSSTLSPDGTRVAFSWAGEDQKNWDIYIKMLGSENPLRLTTTEWRETDPAWSRDGRSIAFIRVEGEEAAIFRVASIGGVATRIGDCSPKARHLAWSPSGDSLVFSDVSSKDGSRQLFALDPVRQTTRPLTGVKGTTAGDSRPVFSPDGRNLIFIRATSLRRDKVMLLSLEDSQETLLTDAGEVRGHDWTPDGRSVIYSSNRAGQFALWRLPISGGEPARLPINDQWVTEPSVARDKNRLIYRKFSDVIDLWSFDLDEDFKVTGDRQRLAPSTRTEFLPTISGDGSRIGFISNRTGEFEVWSSDLTSGELIKHSNLKGPVPGGPAWSPDGRSLVFDSPAAGNLDLYLVEHDSRRPRPLTSGPSDETNASFSRDGSTLYFSSNRSGRFEIWKMEWPDGPVRQVTKNGGFFAQENIEGEYLYYSKTDAGLWRKPLEGGPEERLGALHSYDWASWVPVPGGAVFVTRGPTTIRHLRIEDEARTIIHQPEKQIPYLGRTIALTADSKRLVYAEIAQSDDEVMMVEWPEGL